VARGRSLALAAASVALTLLAAEGLLRATQLDRRLLGDPLEGGPPILRMLQPDPYLQWRGRAGFSPWSGEVLNVRGFRGPVPGTAKPPGVLRIAALGDSCTVGVLGTGGAVGGVVPYPALLQERLDRRGAAPRRFEVFNYGVVGYTTWHGLRLLRSEVLADRPDVVTVRFGWNDHLASPVRRSFAAFRSSALDALEARAYRSRLLALLLRRGVPQLLAEPGRHPAAERPVVWVEEEAFARHLARMIGLARAHGALPILLDAPAAPLTPEIGAAKELLRATGYESFERLLDAHARYQEIVARVAQEEDVPLLRTGGSAPDEYFSPSDLVHPAPGGHEQIARALQRALLELAPAP
jgi:lysophospholipase L1-like esterase